MSNKFKAIAIFGPPGSGKGTQSKVLGSMGSHLHLSTGDMFRGLDPSSELGKQAHAVLSTGKLLSDELTVQIWREFVQSWIDDGKFNPKNQGLLLDGIPRTGPQVSLVERHVEIEKAIVLEVPDHQVLIERLRGRGKIEGRSDDLNEEVLRTRLEIYEKQTKEVISQIDDSKLVKVNGNQKPLEVLRDILIKLAPVL